MVDFILWYVIVSLVGWSTFPILYRVFPGLDDRGYSFSRVLGVLLWGYLFWLLNVLGIARPTGGAVFTLAAVLTVGLAVLYRTGKERMTTWIRDHLRYVLAVEILFLIAFAGWAVVRSFNPAIMGTEKPMELAFINAILRSEGLPPHDPWLSGYAISYYYFGYLLVALLAEIAGTAGGVAFNLGVSLIFGLSAAGAYGLVYNLTGDFFDRRRVSSRVAPLLGPVMALIVSNWEGFLHFLHSRGVFWTPGSSGQQVSRFWSWLGIKDLVNPPTEYAFGHWWWWRASRVIQDIDFRGSGREVISEFPFFSFLLSDLHPHVLAMPFVLLIMAGAFALYDRQPKGCFRWLGIIPLNISPGMFFFLAWITGALGFLNTWDFPIYLALVAGAYTMREEEKKEGFHLVRTGFRFLGLCFSLGATGIILYLPHYLAFSSQAGGLIPNALYITRGAQLWVMFGPLFIPLLLTLIAFWFRRRKAPSWRASALMVGGLILALYFFSTILILGVAVVDEQMPGIGGVDSLEQVFLSSMGAGDIPSVLREGLVRRLTRPGTILTLAALLVPALALLINPDSRGTSSAEERSGKGFVLLLVLGGGLLVLVPEFVFLRDLFGYRINTIFKFYYQAWLLWSMAAAYGILFIYHQIRSGIGLVARALVLISVVMALFYPVLALPSKTNHFSRQGGMSLDGTEYFASSQPYDAQAVAWLKTQPLGTIGEAVGGSYSFRHARMATHTGIPTVLGWDFHEIQWRGSGELVNPRKQDMAKLYCTSDWAAAQEIMARYEIEYLVVGQVEYETYHAGSDFCPDGLREDKFQEHLDLLYSNQGVAVYSPGE